MPSQRPPCVFKTRLFLKYDSQILRGHCRQFDSPQVHNMQVFLRPRVFVQRNVGITRNYNNVYVYLIIELLFVPLDVIKPKEKGFFSVVFKLIAMF